VAAPEDSPRNLVLNGIFAGALFGLVMIGGHLWAVARAGDDAPAPALKVASLAPSLSSLPLLLMPVDGVSHAHLRNSFDEARGSRPHAALDVMAPRDTPVRAVADGTIARLSATPRGGTGVEQHDAADEYCYYYAHLARHAAGLAAGQRVVRGQLLGYVGTTGNAPRDTPHLHFAMFRLGPDRRCWTGTPVNPHPLFR
jgi:murein DD-endopeptidase MepM/ murein hydrolase activator NlpD